MVMGPGCYRILEEEWKQRNEANFPGWNGKKGHFRLRSLYANYPMKYTVF